jgi:excisionase family DNA binding protein
MALSPDTVKMREAAQIQGVSNAKIRRLIRDGVLPAHRNPLDRREELIRRDDLEQLRDQSRRPRRFVSDGIVTAPVDFPASRIKDWMRERRAVPARSQPWSE